MERPPASARKERAAARVSRIESSASVRNKGKPRMARLYIASQRHRASGLNLMVAAIILWNTVYLERAIGALRQQGRQVDEGLLKHVAPVHWNHINLTGGLLLAAEQTRREGRFPATQDLARTLAYFISPFVKRPHCVIAGIRDRSIGKRRPCIYGLRRILSTSAMPSGLL